MPDVDGSDEPLSRHELAERVRALRRRMNPLGPEWFASELEDNEAGNDEIPDGHGYGTDQGR